MCLLYLHAFQATQQPDGLQVLAQWMELIEALSLLSDRYHHHLFQLHERCLKMILCSVSRVLLAILTRWPTTPTQTMECTRSYYKQAVWNPDGMAIDQIPWKKIFSNGVQQIISNQKKFPVKLLRLALFTIGKISQKKFPIKSPASFEYRWGMFRQDALFFDSHDNALVCPLPNHHQQG